jgi:PAS domain S-box-containing protein
MTEPDHSGHPHIVKHLLEGQARLSDFAEVASDWFWELDEHLRAKSVVGGHSPPPALWRGKTPWEVHAADPSCSPWREHRETLLAHLPFRRFEHTFKDANGKALWLTTSGNPIFDAGGTFKGYLGVTTDITPYKAAQEALRQSEERLAAMFAQATVGLCEIDLTGRILRANGELCRILGRSPEEVLRLSVPDVTYRDDIAPSFAVVAEVLTTGRPASIDKRYCRLDGTLVWASSSITRLHDAHGQPGNLLVVTVDLTARRSAEEALRESEARYRLLAENTNDMIVRAELGVSGRRLYVSPASFDTLGYAPNELVGVEARRLIHPSDLSDWEQKISTISAGEVDKMSSVHRLHHRDGSWVVVEVSMRLLREASGEPQEIISTVRDVTARTELEERLRQSQKMEAVGQLTGGVAHDFNNLLTVILGNAEILAEESADSETRSLARMIEDAASRGADLTQKLLAFGRRQSLKPEPLALHEVVQGIMGLLRRTLGEHIAIRTAVRDGGAAALADRALLESAILNLVVNARDAMPNGGKLTIRTGEKVAGRRDGTIPAGQPAVFVTVSDSGTGMSPEVVEHAFEPFFTTKEVGQGSGLGLSMVYGFAQQSGGHVKIQTKEGRGTSVTILLPAVARKAEQSATSAGSSFQLSGGRVLMVEDEPSVREFVCALLTSLGYDAQAVASGPEALKVLERDRSFDLLFTDIVLPQGMSGLELARQARAISPGLKVLLTSGYPEEAFQHHGRPEADMPLLRKPFRRKALAEALRRVIELTSSAQNS